jgi:N-methylhydantoinase B
MERTKFQPWGLFGGQSAPNAHATINPGTDSEVVLDYLDVIELGPGDVLSFVAPGGGGYGDPLERDPELVLRDVRSELLSLESAREHYGVVIHEGQVDVAGSDDLRLELRTGRDGPLADIDLGPTRVKYEAVWTLEASDELIRLLMDLPHSMRLHAKQLVREAVAARRDPSRLTAAEISALFRKLELAPAALQAARV